MYDILIIGAGVVGGLIARELSRYRLRIGILERMPDVAMGATRANSAIVHAGFDAKPGTLKAKLNVRGNAMMEQVTAELGVNFCRNGSLVVGFSEEDRKTLQLLLERGIKNGVPGLSLLNREELLALEPNIGDGVCCALLAPTGGIVCPYGLCLAAVGNAIDNGAELKCGYEVTSIRRVGDFFEVSNGSDPLCARRVVNCAGVYSDTVARLAGDSSFTVTPRRGEYLLLDRVCGKTVSHTVFRCPSKMGKGILVSPTVDGNLLLGPTAEDISDRENTETTAAGLAAVRLQAGEQVKNIDFGKVITSFTGLRAVGSTGDFILNMPFPGFVNCAGIESPGLTSSPAIAEYVVGLLREDGMEIEPRDDFLPTREPMHAFRDADPDKKNDIIRQHPEYARVICRCETVTEGEILHAIRTEPRPTDVDGVKRRTRATMGRCQGGFCTPHIVELLARENGIPPENVTKCGGASRILAGKTKGGC